MKMVDKPEGITLKAIGVRNGIKQPRYGEWEEVISEIVIDSSLTEALDNLDEFSHITVLCWMHQAVNKPPKKVHPMGRSELPLVGLFATRSPHRPNPVGETTVRLLRRRGNILTVQGLDTIDGTPVIDIKPYIPRCDYVVEVRVPPWVTK
jgi:tRNA-Thr(GGU) m(6)t(6)A37 methyltransferase TsaA